MRPQLPPAAVTALYNYLEGDVFRCSRRMAAEDLAIALVPEVVVALPGLPGVSKVALRDALAAVKRRLTELEPSRTFPVS